MATKIHNLQYGTITRHSTVNFSYHFNAHPLQAPGYAFYQLWVNLLWPWFQAGSGDEELSDKDRKRQSKREKKLIRKVYN